MKRTFDIVAVMGIAATLLFVASPLWAPTYTYVRKEVANTFDALQSFNGGWTVGGIDLTMSDFAAPTAAEISTSGGSCSSANQYQFCVTAFNESGTTACNAWSSSVTPTSTTSKIRVTRGTLQSAASQWQAWYRSSA